MRSMSAALATVLLALLAAPAAQAACATTMATTAAVTAATTAGGLPAATVAIGRPTRLALAPVASVTFPARPAKTAGPYAGIFAVDVPGAGAFRIALGARAWIDVAAGGGTIGSVAHQHGAACSGIAKEVTFPLPAGRQVVEITGSTAPTLAVLVAHTD